MQKPDSSNRLTLVKEKVLALSLSDGDSAIIKMPDGLRLVVSYSQRRAKRDLKNRERGLKRLQKNLNKGKLTKSHINNRGYNKYLKIQGDIKIEIDYQKFDFNISLKFQVFIIPPVIINT